MLLVGPGNNGGDALWAGARLLARGVQVSAVLAAEEVHAEGLAALRAGGGRVVPASAPLPAARAAVAGAPTWSSTGCSASAAGRGLRGRAAELSAGTGDRRVVAVDLPSGVDPDAGVLGPPHVEADVTVTFGAYKPCLLLPPAASAAGDVRLVDLGLALDGPAVRRVDDRAARAAWRRPGAQDDKYSRGVVGVVAGGGDLHRRRRAGGAVPPCAPARGWCATSAPAPATDLVRARWPEVVPGPGRVQAWVLGPGVDPDDAGQAEHVRAALAGEDPCVVDAGALGVLPALLRAGEVRAPLLLTPHAGELARLLTDLGHGTARDAVEADPLPHARRAAQETGATVLLKGAVTLVVPPQGPAFSQADGPPWLATAGSGDVLAGVVGAVLASGRPADVAGAVAASVHGRAGWLASGGGPVSASAVLDAVPAAVRELLTLP